MFKFLDQIPLSALILLSVVMLLLPFKPMPHVVEKIIMLTDGELVKSIDIFDLFYHLSPSILLIVKIIKK